MNTDKEKRMKDLLRQALPPVEGVAEPGRDLWPAMLRRLDARPAARQSPVWTCFNEAWFDGVLLAGLVVLAALFPASIPVLLFYL